MQGEGSTGDSGYLGGRCWGCGEKNGAERVGKVEQGGTLGLGVGFEEKEEIPN